MLEFKPLRLECKPLFDKYVLGHGYRHSEASFSNMYIWQRGWDIRMAADNGALYISMDGIACMPLLCPPFLKDAGDSIAPYLEKCEAYMWNCGNTFNMKCATREMVDKIKQDCGDRYDFVHDDYNSEYVYNASDLINLPGRKYHSKRNHISAFLRAYHGVIEEYNDAYRDECLALQKEWAEEKQPDIHEAEEEYYSIERALDHYIELGFKGCVVKIGGEIAAFSFGERICDDTAIIHIEKARSGLNGLYAFINREFVANFWNDCKYINRAEDMGVPGIRRAKQSYNPVFMLDKFDVRIKRG